MSTPLRPLAITQGDPAGIGPEIVLRAVRERPALLRDVLVALNPALAENEPPASTMPGRAMLRVMPSQR